jgi:hypothetical protein
MELGRREQQWKLEEEKEEEDQGLKMEGERSLMEEGLVTGV